MMAAAWGFMLRGPPLFVLYSLSTPAAVASQNSKSEFSELMERTWIPLYPSI